MAMITVKKHNQKFDIPVLNDEAGNPTIPLNWRLDILSGVAQVIKTIDAPTRFQVGGTLIPTVAEEKISQIQEESKTLKKIGIKTSSTNTYNLNNFKATGYLQAPSVGIVTDTVTNFENVGNQIALKECQAIYILKQSAIDDAVNPSAFQADINRKMNIEVSRLLNLLIFNGTNNNGANYASLFKGLKNLATADETVHDYTITGSETNGRIDVYDEMKDLLPPKYWDLENIYLDMPDKVESYRRYLRSTNDSGQWYTENAPLRIAGYEVMADNAIAQKITTNTIGAETDDYCFLTPAGNLVLAMSTSGMRTTFEYNSKGNAWVMTTNFMAGFGYFNGDAIVMGFKDNS